ncbi:hypothetical protein FACS189411_02630 [Bacteroidia bacterium]|nr:hypothetical protein FACS189411_02630 [Bacteroidia bacterium]
MLAMAYPNDRRLALFNFNTNTGDISVFRVETSPFTSAYGVEFSPNGNYVYLANYTGGQLTQYDIADSNFSATIPYGSDRGGGLKMGPDGRIYVKRQGRYMGVIANPDTPLTAASYLADGFDLGSSFTGTTGLTFSTGLTPPAICPSGLNGAPVPVDDYTTVFVGGNPYCVNVLLNDWDPNPKDELMLVNVYFRDPADADKVSFTFNPADSTICITPKPAAQEGDVIVLTYTIRDDANPIHLCADGKLTIFVTEYPDNIIKDVDCFTTPPGQEWSIDSIVTKANNLATYQSVVTGDIDGDGIVEIICSATPQGDASGSYFNIDGISYYRPATHIAIYKGNNINQPPLLFKTEKPYCWDYRVKYGILKTTISGKDTVLIVVAEQDRMLRAYNYEGKPVWTSNAVYHKTLSDGIAPVFGDANHDGTPEIAIAGSLFNSENGQLICSLPTTPAYSYATNYWTQAAQLVDVFGDGQVKKRERLLIKLIKVSAQKNAHPQIRPCSTRQGDFRESK